MATVTIEAGRELDALVAVEVMGWTRRDEWWITPDGTPSATFEPPRFSTTGDGMLAVLERMRALGWEWQVHTSRDDRAETVFYSLGGRPLSSAQGDTLPHAVCLTALEAVRA